MRSISVLGAAALLAVLPAAANAQTQAATDVVVKENTTIVVKETPKPSPVTFTPYGFFLVNAFFNDAAGSRNYPFPSACSTGVACEGNVLFDVRQTRLGSRLSFNDTAGWTKATLSALVEVDFNGGYTGAVATSSAGFYNPAIRLRKAYADAAWGTESKLTVRLGQDDRLISPLRPVSLAYVANPLFQNAGLQHGRAPMFQVRWDLTPKDGIGLTVAGAALNPQDNTATDNGISPSSAVDLGAGNRSRIPNFEGRVSASLRSSGKTVVGVDAWAGWQKNRFVSPATDTNVDVNSYIYGANLTLNLWIVQLLGGISQGYGYDVPGTLGASQGIALTVTRATPTSPFAITGSNAVKAKNGWFQVSARPIEAFQIYGGWGGTQSPFNAYTGSVLAVSGTRVQNFMWAAGIIGYAGKNWRFSAEYGRATSFFYTGRSYTQGQFSLNSQLVF
ncbi:MAG: hypothetical protein RJA59_1000 [Pseudomonadota bacterium]